VRGVSSAPAGRIRGKRESAWGGDCLIVDLS
jgi:hypothetical protein